MQDLNDSFSQELKKFANCVRLKADLIVHGIQVADSVSKKGSFNTKQIHLYQHHVASHKSAVPEDLILYTENEVISKSIVSKLRYNPESEWILEFDNGYKLQNHSKGTEISSRFKIYFDQFRKYYIS